MSGNRSPEDNTRALLECKHAFKLLFVQFCQFVLLCTAAAKDRYSNTVVSLCSATYVFFLFRNAKIVNERNERYHIQA